MNTTQSVYLRQAEYGVPPVVHAVQHDTGRTLQMIVADRAIPANTTAELSFKRSDESHYAISCDSLDTATNSYTADITQALTQAGPCECQLKVDGIVSTFTFIIDVQEDASGAPTEQEGITIKDALDLASEAATQSADALELAQEAAEKITGIERQFAPVTIGESGLSGNVITFETDIAWPLHDLTVGIEAVQSGSGDPSPTNVRPISGWGEASITNVSDVTTVPFTNILSGVSMLQRSISTSTGEETAESTTRICTTMSDVFDAGVYTIKCPTGMNIGRRVYDSAETFIQSESDSEWTAEDITFTATAQRRLRVVYRHADNSTIDVSEVTNPMALMNVFGGSLDVPNGVLTVDRAIVDLGTLTWTFRSNTSLFYAAVSDKENSVENNAICSKYAYMGSYTSVAYAEGALENGGIATSYNTSRPYVYIMDTAYSDAASFKTAMDGVQLVYELATPQEYDLTPTEVTTLLGLNNIWADTGAITDLAYPIGTDKYIDSRTTDIIKIVELTINFGNVSSGGTSAQGSYSTRLPAGYKALACTVKTFNNNNVIPMYSYIDASDSSFYCRIKSSTDTAQTNVTATLLLWCLKE